MPAVLCVHNNGTVSVLRDLSQEEAEAVVERLTFAKKRDTIGRELMAKQFEVEKRAKEDPNYRGLQHEWLPCGAYVQVWAYEKPLSLGGPLAMASCQSWPQTQFSRVEII